MYISFNAIYYSQMAGQVRRQLVVEEDPQLNPLDNDDRINTAISCARSSTHVCWLLLSFRIPSLNVITFTLFVL